MTLAHESFDNHDEFDDVDDDDDPTADLLPCPACGTPIYDDTDQCPHCGDYVTPLAAAARNTHWFTILIITLLIAAFVLFSIF